MKRRRPKLPRTCPKCGQWGGYGLSVRARKGGRAYLKSRPWWSPRGWRTEPHHPDALRVYYPLAQHRDLWRVCDDPWHQRFHYPDPIPPPPVSVDPLPKVARAERTKAKKVEHKAHQGKDRR